jgi:hypothetical protein
MSPRISFTYRPDFSEPRWGYYGSLQIPDSTEYTWDQFSGNVFGATSASEQQSVGFQLTNLFQFKRAKEDQVIRRDLFNMNMSVSHNFAAEEFPWSDLSTSFRTSPVAGGGFGPLKSLSIDLTFRHSLYQEIGGQRIERFVWEDFSWSDPEILRLKQTNISVNTRFSGGGQRQTSSASGFGGILWQEPETITPSDTIQETPSQSPTLQPAWDMIHIPWEMSVSSHYTINRSTDTHTFWISGSIDLELTAKWRIGYTTRLDLDEYDVVSSGLTIYRDLHCWEGRFVWNPIGLGKGYFLRISVKSPQLSDIKLERRRGSGTFLGI